MEHFRRKRKQNRSINTTIEKKKKEPRRLILIDALNMISVYFTMFISTVKRNQLRMSQRHLFQS